MAQNFNVLSHQRLTQAVYLLNPPESHGSVVSLESPAICAMTDLSHTRPLIIDPFATITEANEKMISYAVRMLFVVQAQQQMIGIISATDILGEKPVKYMHEVNSLYEDIQVRDIMTPVTELEVLTLPDVERGRIGDIVETLRRSGRQHALVLATDADDMPKYICGIFSSSNISRLMNTRVEVAEVANNFAAIQSALSQAT